MPPHSRSPPPPSRRDGDSQRTSRYSSGNAPYPRDRYLDSRRGQRFDDSDKDWEAARSKFSERPREERRRNYDSRRSSEEHEQPRRRDRDRNGERDRDRDRDARDRSLERRRSASPPSRSRHSESPPVDKAKPIFAHSGLLAAATKTVIASDGTQTVLKYHEPPEARRPVLGWRLYVFKGDEQVELLHINKQSAYLVGRDRLVADIPIDHPSCSKQHAAIQYRQVTEKDEFGESKSAVKPFIIDLESTNGTCVNGEVIPVSRFYELKVRDVIIFGQSKREYVLLNEEASSQ